jgi:hypothetical protein
MLSTKANHRKVSVFLITLELPVSHSEWNDSLEQLKLLLCQAKEIGSFLIALGFLIFFTHLTLVYHPRQLLRSYSESKNFIHYEKAIAFEIRLIIFS